MSVDEARLLKRLLEENAALREQLAARDVAHEQEVAERDEELARQRRAVDALGKAIEILHPSGDSKSSGVRSSRRPAPHPGVAPVHGVVAVLEVSAALVTALIGAGFSQRAALELAGVSRSTWHYRTRPRVAVVDPVSHAKRRSASWLSAEEREQVTTKLEVARLRREEAGLPGLLRRTRCRRPGRFVGHLVPHRSHHHPGPPSGTTHPQAPLIRDAQPDGHRPRPGMVLGHRAPRGAAEPSGGERPPPSCCRSSTVKLRAARTSGTGARVEAALTTTGRVSTARWRGSG